MLLEPLCQHGAGHLARHAGVAGAEELALGLGRHGQLGLQQHRVEGGEGGRGLALTSPRELTGLRV